MSPRRHRLAAIVTRRLLKGAVLTARVAMWGSIYSVLLPAMIFVMATGTYSDPEGSERDLDA